MLLISVHGLIRGQNLELGCDADTGGQTRYVVELAGALGEHPGIARVDILTSSLSLAPVDCPRKPESAALKSLQP